MRTKTEFEEKLAKKNKDLFGEFKKFAFKGNIFDMAVGVVIGGAFGKIVSSLVADIITPLISLLTKGQNFTELFFVLNCPEGVDKAALTTVDMAKTAGCAVLTYGNFIQAIIDFLIIAFSVFMFLRVITKARTRFEEVTKIAEKKAKEEEEAKAPPKPTTEELLTEIIDLMKNKEN